MIRVTIESLPQADPHRAETVKVLTVTDMGRTPGNRETRTHLARLLEPRAEGRTERGVTTIRVPTDASVMELVLSAMEALCP